MNAKFHWRMLQGGETSGITRATGENSLQSSLPDLDAQVAFCRRAEAAGICGLLTDVGASRPDPILFASAVGMATEKIEFIVAYRSGLIPPTTFVQQLNTLSALINGRFSLNIVAGHSPQEQRYYGDFLAHDARYARTEEFLAVCRAFWKRDGAVNFSGKYYQIENGQLQTPFVSDTRTFPELFIGGGSEAARDLAITQGTCWMRMPDTPENLSKDVQPVLAAGKEVGLRMSVIVRPTREEAVRAAYALVGGLDAALKEGEKERTFMRKSDSVSIKQMYEFAETEWPTTCLWTGAVRTHGAPTVALVGTPEEVASALIEYEQVGVSQFILSGWPKLDEMVFFGREVLPLVRKKERKLTGETRQFESSPKVFSGVPA